MSDPHRFDDLFGEFGPIRLRRFFGGEGIYAGDTMLGMVFNNDTIYFKTDAETRKAFDAEKSKPFTFYKGKELITTTWLSLPDRLYDDPDELAQWARAALKVAQASPAAKKKARKAVPASRAPRKKR
ncbi:MAG: TfoX/Sxy family protein [Alphaproteobacteria bacterium]|nr:TfoX/Sxy family protein [Alphaproteobacteria bacterium]MBL6939277.1 TfoX/Sxy family protein [Alphaproteobacteria bacterium]MBL7096793.1 TfoX/Sxy family protein [Alphaproteobacteria bacterium]